MQHIQLIWSVHCLYNVYYIHEVEDCSSQPAHDVKINFQI